MKKGKKNLKLGIDLKKSENSDGIVGKKSELGIWKILNSEFSRNSDETEFEMKPKLGKSRNSNWPTEN